MRLEATNRDGQYKVWLTDREMEELRRAASSFRDDLIIQLGAYVGLRSFEIPQIKPKHVRRTDDGEHYRLRVPRGKDTQNGTGKPRNAYLRAETERDLHQFQSANDIGRTDPYIDLSDAGVRAVVDRVAERAAEQTGDEDFQHVSSHDLRRRFAQRLLVDESMNPPIGGWDSFQAIEPYLNAPSEDVINQAFDAVDI